MNLSNKEQWTLALENMVRAVYSTIQQHNYSKLSRLRTTSRESITQTEHLREECEFIDMLLDPIEETLKVAVTLGIIHDQQIEIHDLRFPELVFSVHVWFPTEHKEKFNEWSATIIVQDIIRDINFDIAYDRAMKLLEPR